MKARTLLGIFNTLKIANAVIVSLVFPARWMQVAYIRRNIWTPLYSRCVGHPVESRGTKVII